MASNNADILFTDCFSRIIDLWLTINTFHSVVQKTSLDEVKTEPMAKEIERLGKLFVEFLDTYIPKESSIRKMLDEFFSSATMQEEMIEHATKSTLLKPAQHCANSASIVFAHSILDSLLFDFCQITSLVDPDAWESRIQAKQVSFSRLKDSSPDDIRNELITKYLENELERESLIKKCDVLYQLCRPEAGWTYKEGYTYDRSKLESLDNLRHNIVHAVMIEEEIHDIEDKLNYMRDTCWHFYEMISQKYRLKIVRSHLIKKLTQS